MSDITVKKTVLATMHYAFDKTVWHPALEQALKDVSAEQASWRPAEGRNTIWEIVRHVTLWKSGLLKGWEALAAQDVFKDYSAQDWQPVPQEAIWEEDVAELIAVSRAFIAQIEQDAEEVLLSTPEGSKTPRIWNVINNATHDAYHAGQIMYLRKLQGL